jgi:hypothetical protein
MGAPKWRQKPDSNQADIVTALEKIGASVYDATRVGGGFPDLVVGYRQCCLLLELKTETGKLNKKQSKFRDNWNGHFAVVRSPIEAVKVVTEHVKNYQNR